MLIWKRKPRAAIHDDDLRAAVHSRNRQSNHDTWEINITLIIVGLMIVGAVLFQVELHDYLILIFTEGK